MRLPSPLWGGVGGGGRRVGHIGATAPPPHPNPPPQGGRKSRGSAAAYLNAYDPYAPPAKRGEVAVVWHGFTRAHPYTPNSFSTAAAMRNNRRS